MVISGVTVFVWCLLCGSRRLGSAYCVRPIVCGLLCAACCVRSAVWGVGGAGRRAGGGAKKDSKDSKDSTFSLAQLQTLLGVSDAHFAAADAEGQRR